MKIKTILVCLVVASLCAVMYLYVRGRHNESSIVVLQYIDHPALNASLQSFIERLDEKGYGKKGSGVRITVRNAQGDPNLVQNLVHSVEPKQTDVIFTLATPISQAVKRRFGNDSSIALVYGIITDPVSSGLVDSFERPGGNGTATSDQWPYREQMALISEILPDAKRVGVVANPAEVNSQVAMKQVRVAASDYGLVLVERPVASVNDVVQAMSSLIGKVDVMYVPADNTAMAAAQTIIQIGLKNGIPTVAGDPGTFDSGALVGLGVSYEDLGVVSADIVIQILEGNVRPGEIPVGTVKSPELMVNLSVAAQLGIEVPDDILDRAQSVVDHSTN